MKMNRTFLTIAVAGILAGCAETTETVVEENWLGESSVGTIDGVNVPESVFRRLSLDTIQKPVEEMTPEEREAMLDRLVTFQIAATEGERLGLHEERNIAASLELARLTVLANSVVERHLEDNPPSEAELRERYEQRIENLSGTEYKARHILVESEDEATSLIEQLDGGADFAALAEEFSTGPTGPSGGDLGWFAPDRMVAPFSAAVQDLEVGAFSTAPVQTQFGWHVILLEDTRDQQPPGMESMRVELTSIAQQQRVQAFLQELRDAADIAVE